MDAFLPGKMKAPKSKKSAASSLKVKPPKAPDTESHAYDFRSRNNLMRGSKPKKVTPAY